MSAWNRFWFVERPTLPLGLFRVAFSGCLAWELYNSFWSNVFAIEGGYHLPYLSWIPLLSEPVYRLLHYAQVPLIALFGLGLLTRTAGTLLLGLQSWLFFADQLNFRNHPYFFLLVLLLLILAPSDDAVSVSAALRARRQGRSVRRALAGDRRPVVFQRLIQLQVCLVYGFAGLHKLTPAFLGGRVLASQVSETLAANLQTVLGWLAAPGWLERVHAAIVSPGSMRAMSVATVVAELALPLALWPRRSRAAAIVAGVLFHAGIALSMSIYAFSAAMIASYLLFADPDALRRRAGSIRPFTVL